MSEPQYNGKIKITTAEVEKDLKSLRSSLAATSWALRALGVSPELKKSIMEVQRAIWIIKTLQMISTGGGIMSAARLGLGAIGLGKLTGGIRAIHLAMKVAGD